MHERHIKPSNERFFFADHSYPSLGKVSIPLKTPIGAPKIIVVLDMVEADIPPLLGMDLLDREELCADTTVNHLAKRTKIECPDGRNIYIDEWVIPMTRAASGHSFVPMDFRPAPQSYISRSELGKLHRQFYHPSTDKLFNLLKVALPEDATPQTRKPLTDITNSCDPCQRIRNAPNRFRVSFGTEHIRFNQRILMDIMYINGDPILHIVDEGTKFSAAQFLSSISTDSIWKAILQCWSSIYTGLPNRALVDQGSQFGKVFLDVAALHDIKVDSTGIEAHSSLGIGERYHQPLRQTFRKIMANHKKTDRGLALALAVKAMNDTHGPEGLVPSVLVFGQYPKLNIPSSKPSAKTTQISRKMVAETGRKEMEKHMAKMKINRALRHAVPTAANRSYEPGDQVLVWCEKIVDNRNGEWLGPFAVASFQPEKKLVLIQDENGGPPKPFNVVQVKPYITPEAIYQSFMSDLNASMSYYCEPENNSNSDTSTQIHLTEIIDVKDPRSTSTEMTAAKKKEIRNLLERGTFKIILKEHIPTDANVLPGRFVLAIKSTEDGEIKFKARYVIGGHRDKEKNMMVHTATTLQPQSIRLLLALANIHDFDIWTSEVRQAYLQSSDPLDREIFIKKPVPEFELDPSECLQLLKPLYGLCESGDLWHKTLDEHHRQELGMKPSRFDPALYRLVKDKKLLGLSGGYVDDLIRAGNPQFKKIAKKTHERFDMDEDKRIPCQFTGFQLCRDSETNIVLNQHNYLPKLEELSPKSSFKSFRSMRMKLAWLAQTRPYCLYEISQIAQISEARVTQKPQEHIKHLNRAVKYAIDKRVSLKIPKLDLDSLRVIGLADAGFAGNHDLSYQLGHITFLGHNTDSVVPIHFKSYKAKRVNRSPMTAEVIAFSDLFDVCITLAEELKDVYGRKFPVQLFTNSRSLFDNISKGSRTSEKRMMIDIAAAREGFKNKFISDIGFVRTNHMLADGLTKSMSQAALQEVLCTAKYRVKVEEWIVRD